MKKFLLFFASALLVSSVFSSCRSHERCAAYGKINKIETTKPVVDNTEKSI
jgi:hypothetical protein